MAIYNDGMAKNVIHTSEAEAARDFASRMARVRTVRKSSSRMMRRPLPWESCLAKLWASEKHGFMTSISSRFLGRLSSKRIY